MRTVIVNPSKRTEPTQSLKASSFHRIKTIRPTLKSETKTLRAFSNSRLESISECPTFGVVHSQRQYPQHGRALALEAGEAMHQFFAAMRLWQLEYVQKLPEHAKSAGHRIFGKDRFDTLRKEMLAGKTQIDQIAYGAHYILQTSGYHDDPDEKTRTLSNMETAAMEYAKECVPYLKSWPIWYADKKNPEKPIGIEIVFDVVIEYEDGHQVRFIGTLDGILFNAERANRVTMAENKTAARIDRAWIESFKMRHQVTGYIACGQALLGVDMWHGRIYGVKIKPTYKGEDVHVEPFKRDPEAVAHWGNWVRCQTDLFEAYKEDWEHAERRTHSCNRFFRPCALIPFCADSSQGRKEQWAQMIEAVPSPSERAVLG